jgi:hypothetical protein
MQLLAMYLPQFHQVKENDEWWGEGFTDWVSAKKAKPLFEGHYQPHIPKDNNYYDLSEKKVMQWQADLMHQYGVDGMCIYHYWFEDGRRILEKPAENLLEWKDIDMPYCFCWANETWARSWSTYKKGNVWSEQDETEAGKGEDGILLKQSYGQEEEWNEHFEYLFPFFQDKRYIRKDGKPLFLIYKSSEIYCLREMVDFFNKKAKAHGLPGIYFVCANAGVNLPENVDAALIHEPQNAMRSLGTEQFDNDVRKLDYELCWKQILQCEPVAKKTYFGGFVGYDDTPRRGIQGTVITDATPEKFKNNLIPLMAKNEACENDFIFLNAWNEWGEGMHLEPDEKWGYQYLESINEARSEYAALKESGTDFKFGGNSFDVEKIKSNSMKYETYLNMLDLWMELRENGVSLEKYFTKRGYMRIAVYGYGIFARHLMRELNQTSVKIECLIDKQRDKISCGVKTILPGDEPEGLDVIVVTSFHFFEEIRKQYAEKEVQVVSMENILKEVMDS